MSSGDLVCGNCGQLQCSRVACPLSLLCYRSGIGRQNRGYEIRMSVLEVQVVFLDSMLLPKVQGERLLTTKAAMILRVSVDLQILWLMV